MEKIFFSLQKIAKAFLLLAVVSCSNKVISASIVLPKDPGLANDLSIDGIDSNKNGVRDDVEILIGKEITQDPLVFKAYMKWAETELQKLKEDPKNEKLQGKLFLQSENDLTCISSYQNIDAKNINKLVHTILNTDLRKKHAEKILAIANKFPNQTWISPEKRRSLCRF